MYTFLKEYLKEISRIFLIKTIRHFPKSQNYNFEVLN